VGVKCSARDTGILVFFQVDKQLESQLDMATKKAERLENRLEELTRRIDAEKQKVEMESKGEAQLRRTIEKLEEKARLLQFQHDKVAGFPQFG